MGTGNSQFGNGEFPIWEGSRFGRVPILGWSQFEGEDSQFWGLPCSERCSQFRENAQFGASPLLGAPQFPQFEGGHPQNSLSPPPKSPSCPFKTPLTPKPTAPPGGPAVSPKPRPFPFGRARASLGLFRRPGGDGCEGRGGGCPPHWPVRSRRPPLIGPCARAASAAPSPLAAALAPPVSDKRAPPPPIPSEPPQAGGGEGGGPRWRRRFRSSRVRPGLKASEKGLGLRKIKNGVRGKGGRGPGTVGIFPIPPLGVFFFPRCPAGAAGSCSFEGGGQPLREKLRFLGFLRGFSGLLRGSGVVVFRGGVLSDGRGDLGVF